MRTPKETKIPGFPKLPPDASPALRRYLESVVEAVEVRLGRRGDPRDRAVTARELIDSGLAVEGKPFVLGQNQATLLPAGEDLETSLPTAPTGFEATGAYSVVILDWDQAYLQYAPHAFTEVWRHDTDQLADAILVGVEHGSVFTDQVGSDASYYYWVRHVNTRDQRGPWNSNSGTFAETAVDVEFMLELLNGEITESQLYNTLASRINLIDGNGAGSVNVRIGQEIAAEVISRNAAILVEVNARTAAIQAEAAARTAAINTQAAASAADILAEAVDRANGDTALDTQLTTLTSVTLPGNYASIAALQQEASTRSTADSAEATSRETLATQMRGNYSGTDVAQLSAGLVFSEKTSRVTADSALSSRSDVLEATVNNPTTGLVATRATLTNDYYTQTDTDSAIASAVTSLVSTTDLSTALNAYVTNATLTTNYYTQTDTDSAIASAITSLVSTTDLSTALNAYVTNATLTTNYYTQTDTDTAIASAITSLVSTTDLSTALNAYVTNATLTTNYYTQTDTDTAIASAVTSLVSTTDLSTALGPYATNATLTTNHYTKTDADTAIASAVTNLVSTTDLSTALGPYATNATLTTNHYTKTDADSAIASAVTNLVSTTTLGNYTTTADLTTNYYTKTAADSAIASATTNLVSTSDLAGYATSSSVQQNFFAKADGESLEGQYTVKIDNNGNVAGFGLANTTTAAGSSSQFLVAADRFAIVGPNGTGLVPFTVQTTTTTVGGNTILPGVYITDAYIKNASITNLKIGDLAVDSAKIALLAVDTAQINNLAVDTAKIKDLAVETAKIKDLSVETAKINNQAVTVPSGVNQDTFLTLSTSWQTVCSLTVNMGTGVQAVLVSAFHNYQNTAQTSTQYDIAMKIEANGSGGGSVAHTHGNQTAVISSMAKYGGLTGNVLFTIKVKKNANAGTYRARNSGLLVQGIKK